MNCIEIRRKPIKTTKISAALPCPCPGPCPYASKNGAGERKARGKESGRGGEESGSGIDAHWSGGAGACAARP